MSAFGSNTAATSGINATVCLLTPSRKLQTAEKITRKTQIVFCSETLQQQFANDKPTGP